MTFVEGVPPSKHFRCITQRYVLRSPITQPNIPEEQVAYRQFPRPSPLPRRRGSARLGHALYNRPLDAHARREKRLGTSQEESKIFIYFILKSLDLFIEEILFPVFAGAIFRFCQ